MSTIRPAMQARIQREYAAIRGDCAIVTACDAKHAPYLLNAIASFDAVFSDRPRIIVYDIGLSPLTRVELRRHAGVELRAMPAFVPHWRLNWSWKLHALTHDLPRYVLYLDLPNFVALRSLAPWFVSIRRNGYFVVANRQFMRDVVPADYWTRHDLDRETGESWPTFGAGIVGYDREGPAARALAFALDGVKQGLNLGRSATEKNANYQPDIVRDCPCFRADQTLLNLNFRRVFGDSLQVRRADMYSGHGGSEDHAAQYLWYARRNRRSLLHLSLHQRRFDAVRTVNRAVWLGRISLKEAAKHGLVGLRRWLGSA